MRVVGEGGRLTGALAGCLARDHEIIAFCRGELDLRRQLSAVVTKDMPLSTIVGGNPARVIRKRFEPEIEQLVSASEWWLQRHQRL